jgi:hypothetical protein
VWATNLIEIRLGHYIDLWGHCIRLATEWLGRETNALSSNLEGCGFIFGPGNWLSYPVAFVVFFSSFRNIPTYLGPWLRPFSASIFILVIYLSAHIRCYRPRTRERRCIKHLNKRLALVRHMQNVVIYEELLAQVCHFYAVK